MKRFVPLALGLAAAGCTVGPNYKQPKLAAETPPAYAEPAVPPVPDAPPVDLGNWWHAFGDPELDRLIALGLSDSPDVQTALSRIREARLTVVSARAAEFPELDAQGMGEVEKLSHEHTSVNSEKLQALAGGALGGAASGGATGGTTTGGSGGSGSSSIGAIKMFSAGFDASWELDLFGGVRRSVEAARAQAQAAEYDAEDTRISLASEIAQDYLQLRLAQQRFHVVQGQIAAQQRSLQILQETARVGLVPQTNFIRQRTQLATSQAQLPPLVAQAKTQIHALAILTGHPPAELFQEVSIERPAAVPPAVPPGLPSELLRRRPDVRAAERQLAAATAQVGVAVADLYPRITLTGMEQLVSDALGGLLKLRGVQSTAEAQGTFPILDFGRRRATVEIRREEAEQAYQSYRQTVLGAFRDVEDALARVASDQSNVQVLTGGLADANRAELAVRHQYDVGLTDFDAVLNAQQSVLQIADQLAQAQGQERTDLVSLYKALGGGWDPDHLPAVPPRPHRDTFDKD